MASRAPIRLEELLEEEEEKVNENGGMAGIGEGGSCCGGLVEGNMLNMCNKTCSVPLSHLGSDVVGNEASPRSAGSIPSKRGPLRTPLIICHLDICTMFPPVAQICTPHVLATKQVMEDELAVQAKEELSVAERVQALREKFAAAANNKFLAAKEKEVR